MEKDKEQLTPSTQILTPINNEQSELSHDKTEIKNIPSTQQKRIGNDSSLHSGASSPNNRRRSKRFEDALLKWQEYGNDIIERKPPNFLQVNNKPKKGAWIYGGEKHDERMEFEDYDEESIEERSVGHYAKHLKYLSGRFRSNFRDFHEMNERADKIQETLKQLKDKIMENP